MTVLPSTAILSVPTGTGLIRNCPCASETPVREVPRMRMVAPGTGMSLLSRATPLMLVWRASPGTMAEAAKTTGRPVLPGKVASTRLFSIPSSGPRVSVTAARPSESVVTVFFDRPPKLPLPSVAVKVMGILASR